MLLFFAACSIRPHGCGRTDAAGCRPERRRSRSERQGDSAGAERRRGGIPPHARHGCRARPNRRNPEGKRGSAATERSRHGGRGLGGEQAGCAASAHAAAQRGAQHQVAKRRPASLRVLRASLASDKVASVSGLGSGELGGERTPLERRRDARAIDCSMEAALIVRTTARRHGGRSFGLRRYAIALIRLMCDSTFFLRPQTNNHHHDGRLDTQRRQGFQRLSSQLRQGF